ncbi:permease-like cell division protein FtsX [Ferruginibacter sp.]
MNKLCLILLLFFIYSCNNKNAADKGQWLQLDSAHGISYKLSEKGRGERGDVSIKYIGRMENDKLILDSAEGIQFIPELMITPMVADKDAIKQLPEGSKGFISVNSTVFFAENFAEIKHYILYFNGAYTDKSMKEDSLKLAAMSFFKSIELVNSEKALEKFTEDNKDIEWKGFVKANPLPASIELTLKETFLTSGKYDSIKNVLQSAIPAITEIQMPFKNDFWNLNGGLKQSLVYKFVIF